MKVEDIKEPCVDCYHEPSCVIRHPELRQDMPVKLVQDSCEKLNKYSLYVNSTRRNH